MEFEKYTRPKVKRSKVNTNQVIFRNLDLLSEELCAKPEDFCSLIKIELDEQLEDFKTQLDEELKLKVIEFYDYEKSINAYKKSKKINTTPTNLGHFVFVEHTEIYEAIRTAMEIIHTQGDVSKLQNKLLKKIYFVLDDCLGQRERTKKGSDRCKCKRITGKFFCREHLIHKSPPSLSLCEGEARSLGRLALPTAATGERSEPKQPSEHNESIDCPKEELNKICDKLWHEYGKASINLLHYLSCEDRFNELLTEMEDKLGFKIQYDEEYQINTL